MASGGNRPTAPQNNYSVSATGGSGNGGTQAAQAMTGGAYGENQAMQELQTSAPMNASPTFAATPSMGRPQTAPVGQQIVPLDAPTQRPDEPVTTGIDAGAGAGSSALMMKKSTVKLSDTLAQMLPYDTDGSIAILYQDALARGN